MRPSRFMMHCIVGFALVLGMIEPSAAADVTTVAGQVTYVSTEVVEVAGRRGLFATDTAITSDGRAISLGAIQVGMPAELEIDPSGRALELRVKGAVE